MRLRLRRGRPTETSRLEAFSDGVFAVAITLLALDLGRIRAQPDAVPPVTLFASLTNQWPTLLAFAGAFAFVGIAWTNHHNVFVRVKAISRSLNGANLVLLAAVVMVPWATSVLAETLGDPASVSAHQAILLYAGVTMLGALTWGLLFHVLGSNPDLLQDAGHAHGFRADRIGAVVGVSTTAIAAAIGYLISPILGTALLALVPVIFAVASEGFEHGGGPSPREAA
ncbi:MAG: TMEM175 family protein [Candidatus Limnocylindrales bacterium]